MYINFWYPIAKSEEITAENPLKVEILSLNCVAFRDEAGQAHVLRSIGRINALFPRSIEAP